MPQNYTQYTNDTLAYPILLRPGVFSYDVAERGADLVIRCSIGKAFPPQLSVTKTLLFDSNPIGAILRDEHETVWVVFRGTATKKEWEQDFNFQHDIFQIGDDACMCSQGFIQIFNGFRDQIHEVLHGSERRVVVVGHSLGSALATLCASYLSSFPLIPEVQCYTFGGPRVCSDLHLGHKVSLWRIVNTCDIVQQLPLSVMWDPSSALQTVTYTHVGILIYFTVNKQNLQDNHTMPVYIEALRRRLLQIPGPADAAPR